MAPDKVTVMILNVDLKCSCCYKKVKKVLCKFPQIRDQVFDEDKNKVKITVVCCNPEKLRDKICCKGGKAIQSIEIVENKPPDNPKPKPKPEPDPKPSPPVIIPTPIPVPKPKSADPPPPKVDPPKPKVDPPPPKVDPLKPKVDPPPPKVDPPKPKVDPPPPKPVPTPDPIMPGYCPPVYPVPISACCQECYQGRSGGPCHDFGFNNYGRPVPPPPGPCYDGYGYPYAQNRPCYPMRCDYYFSEENPQGCSIM